MQFDVIIGNPPFQKDIGGVRPKEIYSDFIIKAISLSKETICLITPTRWYNGNTSNMHKVRQLLLNTGTIKLIDYQKADDIFINTQISGGLSYWLHSKKLSSNKCSVKHIVHNLVETFDVKLDNEVFIRYKDGASILDKVLDKNEYSIADTYGFWMTFDNIHIDDFYNAEYEQGDLKFTNRIGITSYINRLHLDAQWIPYIDKYKVITGAMTPGGGVQKADSYRVINTPKIMEPNKVFSDYYYTLGVFDSLADAINFNNYVKTKFVRFLIQLLNNTTSLNKSKFRYVPVQDYSIEWTDELLYAKYNLSNSEINFIEKIIKTM